MYKPHIVTCPLNDLTDEYIRECRKKGIKMMPHIPGDEWEAYRIALSKDIDMVTVDNPDVLSDMAKNNGIFKGYKLIAHRGGIVEGKYNEFDPATIRTAIDQGYTIPKLARGEDIACHYFLFENGNRLI